MKSKIYKDIGAREGIRPDSKEDDSVDRKLGSWGSSYLIFCETEV